MPRQVCARVCVCDRARDPETGTRAKRAKKVKTDVRDKEEARVGTRGRSRWVASERCPSPHEGMARGARWEGGRVGGYSAYRFVFRILNFRTRVPALARAYRQTRGGNAIAARFENSNERLLRVTPAPDFIVGAAMRARNSITRAKIFRAMRARARAHSRLSGLLISCYYARAFRFSKHARIRGRRFRAPRINGYFRRAPWVITLVWITFIELRRRRTRTRRAGALFALVVYE